MFSIKNLHSIDRIIRLIFFGVTAFLFFTHAIPHPWALILFIFGIVLAITAFINFCPIYYGLGISTRKKNKKEKE